MTTEHDNVHGDAGRASGPVTMPGLLAQVYGIYVWLAFLVCVGGALVSALALPGTERRRRWVTRFARLPFRLAAIPVTVHGLERLPAGQCIVVANHSSYLDGILLQAFLPPRFSYVIKGEMQNVPFVHFLLRRIGSRFVNRQSAGASARDARTLLRAADGGESLAFFPEGTFHEQPGLAAFRGGAFAAAIRAGLPVVPIVIRGARHVLPSGRLLPRRGPLEIEVLASLAPDAADSSRELAGMVRQRMLAVLGEPDLHAKPAG